MISTSNKHSLFLLLAVTLFLSASFVQSALAALVPDATPEQTFSILQSDKGAFLVDVRTDAELHFLGAPQNDALANDAIRVPYLLWPGMDRNENFAMDVMRALRSNANFDIATSRVFFMCCCGGRSKRSSQEMQDRFGVQAFNVLYGFEGDLHPQTRHRGELNGWKYSALPWRQD